MSISIQDVCNSWNLDNEGYESSWEYDLESDSYKMEVKHLPGGPIVIPSKTEVSTRSTIPAYKDSIGSAVVSLVLDVLKAQLVLFEDYGIFI